MPMKNERTGAVVKPDPDASSLMMGRKEGEAFLISFEGTDVVVFFENIRNGRCDTRVFAHPAVQIARLRGSIEGF